MEGATNAGLVDLQIEYWAPADLLLDKRNPRQHPQRQVNQLADSIREFGFMMPVIIDTLAGMSGLIDDGKVRALAALTETPPINHEKLPTIAAAGFEGYAADTWNGFMLPGGTPGGAGLGGCAQRVCRVQSPKFK